MPAKKEIQLTMHELREIAGYSVECAPRALPILERDMPGLLSPKITMNRRAGAG